jgi:hypothetical protein
VPKQTNIRTKYFLNTKHQDANRTGLVNEEYRE